MRRKSSDNKKTQAYKTAKKRAIARSKAITALGQDIAPMPPAKNFARRSEGERSFRFFCETYFPDLFNLAWSDDHLRVIAKIESVVNHNDTIAVAMPRGSGKTTLSLVAVVWAIVTGKHPFVYLIASSDSAAIRLLENLKNQFSSNKRLLEDYPEAVYPICCLENESRRCSGQKFYGMPTNIEWQKEEIVMPTIPGSPCSGAVVRVSGLTGNFRGAMHVKPDGKSIRPTLVVCDDPQTDASANSLVQTADRLRILNGTIPGLAGPGKRTAIIVPCTVICEGDLADQLLDNTKNPAWRGQRTKLVYTWPDNTDIWDEYARIREDSFRRGGDGREATVFYERNRKTMDDGAVVAWEARYTPNRHEISALQHAFNLRQDFGEQMFASEFQNEPLRPGDEMEILRPEQVCRRANGRPAGLVPPDAAKLTGFIDVHDNLLYWAVCAWEENFTGYVIEYGTYPEQNVRHFTLQGVKRTLKTKHPDVGVEGAILAGLEIVVGKMLKKTYQCGNNLTRIEKLLVDMGYKDKLVSAVKHKVGGSSMVLSKGVGIKAGNRPISTFKRKPGLVIGHHWFIPNVRGTQEFPHICVDTNYWKSFVHTAFQTGEGQAGNLTLYGKPDMHELFAQHIAASEDWTLTHGQGRDVREWKIRPNRPDNHWLDCLVGCAAAASNLGVKVPGQDAISNMRPKLKMRYSELQRKKKQAMGM